jgi:phage protein D
MRKIKLKVSIEGTDISDHIIEDVISFRYTDQASHKSDDMDLTMLDTDDKWINGWNPKTSEHIEAAIIIEENGKSLVLDCGKFTIDEPEYSSPGVISIKGVSIPKNSDFVETNKNQSWEKADLKTISGTLASRGNLSLDYESSNNPSYEWKEQKETSDMKFIAEETKNNNLNMKISNDKLIIYDDDSFDSAITITRGQSDVKGFSFKKALSSTRYGSCTVSYYDHDKGEKLEYTHSLGEGKNLKINERVSNIAEAKKMAMSRLSAQNKQEATGSLQLVGRVDIFAGSIIHLENFGIYSGDYFVEKVSHNVSSGYDIQLDIRSKK